MEDPWLQIPDKDKNCKKNRREENNFIGYTFKKDAENERTSLILALEKLEITK